MKHTYSIQFGHDLTKHFKRIFKFFAFIGNPKEVEMSKANHPDIPSMSYEEVVGAIIEDKVPKTTLVISTSQDDYNYILQYLSVEEYDIALVHFDDPEADFKFREPPRTINHIEQSTLVYNSNVLILGKRPKDFNPPKLTQVYTIENPLHGVEYPNIGYVFTNYDGPFSGFFTTNGSCEMVHLDHKPWNRKGLPKAYYEYRFKHSLIKDDGTSDLLKLFEPSLVEFLKELPSITEDDMLLAGRIQTYKGLNNDVRELYPKSREPEVYDQALMKVFNQVAKLNKDNVIYEINGTPVISKVLNQPFIYTIKRDNDVIKLGLGIEKDGSFDS